MSSNLLLQYKREGLLYDGAMNSLQFTQLSFSEMMMLAHNVLVANPGCGLVLHRTERPGMLPIVLDGESLRLLKADPEKYIASMSLPSRVIDTTEGSKRVSALVANEKKSIPRGGLRAGHDVLAAALGDTVYIRLRNGTIEHPVSGRWEPISAIDGLPHESLPGADGVGWLTVATEELLKLEAPRFYLPREWNPCGGWISKEQLKLMYEHFVEERSKLC